MGNILPRYCSSKISICYLKLHFRSAKSQKMLCQIAGSGWQLHHMLTKMSLKFEGWDL